MSDLHSKHRSQSWHLLFCPDIKWMGQSNHLGYVSWGLSYRDLMGLHWISWDAELTGFNGIDLTSDGMKWGYVIGYIMCFSMVLFHIYDTWDTIEM